MQIPKFSYSQFQQKQLQLGALPRMIYQAKKLKAQPLFDPDPLMHSLEHKQFGYLSPQFHVLHFM